MGRTFNLTLEDFGLDPNGKRARMKRIALVILSHWKAKANGHSASMRTAYKQALVATSTDSEAVVTFGQPGPKNLTLALMLEFGMGPGGFSRQPSGLGNPARNNQN